MTLVSSPDKTAVPIADLYANHHGWLLGWLRKKLGNSFDAADLAHDTFVRLLAREETPALQEPRAYLTTVAQGVVSNFHRRRKIEAAYLDTLAAMPEQLAPDPETRAILLEALVEIDRRLDGLPLPVRKAFLLSQLDGMTQPQIATELGLSLATVQRYIVKAMHRCFFHGAAMVSAD
ncbi:RNA polymerase sigma factor [Oxalicibacterium flavum]|uniref:RNA polymerase sigma factor n=1 Tax=Oxalicibacterium flavum TaxID=179467 RepID=A0A8J2XXP0_9BURK|nr:sigma-70 family RNA polymerase sigma factor [Oxalicibacterium flavum]GGC02577.1 RNA polymerase sigma factor [Oxalicibacterium flavum]